MKKILVIIFFPLFSFASSSLELKVGKNVEKFEFSHKNKVSKINWINEKKSKEKVINLKEFKQLERSLRELLLTSSKSFNPQNCKAIYNIHIDNDTKSLCINSKQGKNALLLHKKIMLSHFKQ